MYTCQGRVDVSLMLEYQNIWSFIFGLHIWNIDHCVVIQFVMHFTLFHAIYHR